METKALLEYLRRLDAEANNPSASLEAWHVARGTLRDLGQEHLLTLVEAATNDGHGYHDEQGCPQCEALAALARDAKAEMEEQDG